MRSIHISRILLGAMSFGAFASPSRQDQSVPGLWTGDQHLWRRDLQHGSPQLPMLRRRGIDLQARRRERQAKDAGKIRHQQNMNHLFRFDRDSEPSSDDIDQAIRMFLHSYCMANDPAYFTTAIDALDTGKWFLAIPHDSTLPKTRGHLKAAFPVMAFTRREYAAREIREQMIPSSEALSRYTRLMKPLPVTHATAAPLIFHHPEDFKLYGPFEANPLPYMEDWVHQHDRITSIRIIGPGQVDHYDLRAFLDAFRYRAERLYGSQAARQETANSVVQPHWGVPVEQRTSNLNSHDGNPTVGYPVQSPVHGNGAQHLAVSRTHSV